MGRTNTPKWVGIGISLSLPRSHLSLLSFSLSHLPPLLNLTILAFSAIVVGKVQGDTEEGLKLMACPPLIYTNVPTNSEITAPSYEKQPPNIPARPPQSPSLKLLTSKCCRRRSQKAAGKGPAALSSGVLIGDENEDVVWCGR